jgi:single-stranded-DNA-specific exonuclease
MVAMATIADSVPLVGENRVLAKIGLDGLRRPVNGGLKALMQVSQLDSAAKPITATDIAFRVAPRINAAGRMDVAQDVVELFTTRDEARSRELANKLNELNSDRQAEEARIIATIYSRLESDESFKDAYCVVIAGDGWHRGVIGIAATRVVERTCKPALVIAIDGDEAHGSGRSISAFHLLDALESEHCRPLFKRFGGHSHAVGFSMPADQVDALRSAIDAYAKTKLTSEDFVPVLNIDSEISLDEITPEWMRCLEMLEPYGMGNREPIFVARGLRLQQPPRILKEKHIKLKLGQNGRGMDALGWRMAEDVQALGLVVGDIVDVAFTVEENVHPDFGGLQLVICDLVKKASSVASG